MFHFYQAEGFKMSISHRISRRFNLTLMSLTMFVLLPLQAAADNETPAWAAALLPTGAELARQSLDIIDLDPGKSLGADMEFGFPGKYPSCSWSLYKQHMTLELVGQSVDETPEMLDQVIENYAYDLEGFGQALAEDLAMSYKNNSNLKSMGTVQEEQFPNGRIAYIEWTEDCDRHPNGTKAKLTGSARRDATILTFDLVLSATGAEARAMALEILSGFEKLDIAALYQ
jgi:hypothetical protein